MSQYDDTLKDINKTLGLVPGFMKALPEEVPIHDWVLFKKCNFEETEIPEKYRELMGLAVAANIKCPYCQLMHRNMAKGAGATADELAETAFLASYTSRWSAMLHAQNYDMARFEKEVQQIGEHLSKKK